MQLTLIRHIYGDDTQGKSNFDRELTQDGTELLLSSFNK